MLKIQKFEFNPFQVNTFVIFSTTANEGWIIDPGNLTKEEDTILFEFINKNNISVTKIICTHGHLDHLFGVNFIKSKFESDFYFPFTDLPLLENVQKQAEAFGLTIEKVIPPDFDLSESTKMHLDGFVAKFISTPGHSPGGTSLIFNDLKLVFTGDVLFFEGIGRTDLWGGDYKLLTDSIKTKIFNLPDDYEIFPGHGQNTTIGYEKENNPFLV